jgi:hypothetical protein
LKLVSREVLKKLLERDRPTRVTVIAHSQGTVIAFNALASLCSQEEFREKANDTRIEVVTVGSPLTHLYQHYFPTEYPPLDDPKWAVLQKVIKRWYNVFRTDDYVGTYIDADVGNGQQENWLENIPAKPEGHISYWKNDIFQNLSNAVP